MVDRITQHKNLNIDHNKKNLFFLTLISNYRIYNTNNKIFEIINNKLSMNQ